MDDLEMQQYLFDLQGYLMIENVLSAEEIALFNAKIDQHHRPPSEKTQRFGSAPDGAGFLDWGKPFCDLLDHSAIMPVLRFRLGDCFRLDRLYGISMKKGMPSGRLHADYGANARNVKAVPGEYFPFRDNAVLNGFVVVAWNLSATGPDYGGFCCIPGSHKCNFKLPKKIYDAPEKAPCVIIPSAPAGSVILFSEALTHGTYAWTGDHERRSLLYKYCVSFMAWRPNRVAMPTQVELTPRQKILFNEPADAHIHFPSLFKEVEPV